MNAISKARCDQLYPPLGAIWIAVDAQIESEFAAEGITNRIDQGLRTWAEQDADYAQGRTTPGPIVTHAKGGESYHEYALALDFVPMQNGQPIWDRTHPCYARTIAIAESKGLISGSRWPEPKTDFPHLEMQGPYPENAPDDICKQLFANGGLPAVWAEVDKFRSMTS